MPKYAVIIKPNDDDFYWSADYWKDEVCMDFDENVVIPDKNLREDFQKAAWWQEAKEVADLFADMWNYEDMDEFITDNSYICAKDKFQDIVDLYQEKQYDCEDIDFIVAIAKILFPFLTIEQGHISSYGESEPVVYVAEEVDLRTLEDWFYGNIWEVNGYELDTESMEEDEISMEELSASDVTLLYGKDNIDDHYTMTDTHYWELYHSDALLSDALNYFGYPAEDTILIKD
jgi:hypothetical protein